MARAAKQTSFHGKGFDRQGDCFGGSLLKGNNPKTKRPLESKLPIHLVLRAKKGTLGLPKTFKQVNETVAETSKKHGVKIYKYANLGNHLHILIKISSVRRWAAFIRELTGRIAQLVKEFTLDDNSFWLHRPFTRIVRGWQKAFRTAKEYVELNQLEANGHISRHETKTLNDLRAIFSDA